MAVLAGGEGARRPLRSPEDVEVSARTGVGWSVGAQALIIGHVTVSASYRLPLQALGSSSDKEPDGWLALAVGWVF